MDATTSDIYTKEEMNGEVSVVHLVHHLQLLPYSYLLLSIYFYLIILSHRPHYQHVTVVYCGGAG